MMYPSVCTAATLRTGTWDIIANGFEGRLNIASIDAQGNLSGWKELKQAKSKVIGMMVQPIQTSEYSLLASLRQVSGTLRSLVGTVDYSGCIRTILAVVIVVSVASILITPDPSDDVNGVMQQKHLVKATVVPISALQSRSLPHFTIRFAPVVSQRLVQFSLLHLVCVRLC
jgi:hypothetical protein